MGLHDGRTGGPSMILAKMQHIWSYMSRNPRIIDTNKG
jgi:hypothetical protein